MEKEKQKAYAAELRKAKRKKVKPGDPVMVHQKKSTSKTPWVPRFKLSLRLKDQAYNCLNSLLQEI